MTLYLGRSIVVAVPIGDFGIDLDVTPVKRRCHPQRGHMTIDKAIQLYAWHGLHRLAVLSWGRLQQTSK